MEKQIKTMPVIALKGMDDSIYELYQAGKVTKDEAITFAQDKVALEKRLF